MTGKKTKSKSAVRRRKRRVWTRQAISQIRKLRREGKTLAQIGKKVRRGPGQIYQLLNPRPAETRRRRPKV